MAEQKLPDKAQENEMKREKVRVVPIKYIDDSPDHPFQVRDDEEMMSLVESIATFGVITPIIARKTADERYELSSWHRVDTPMQSMMLSWQFADKKNRTMW